MKVFRVKEGPGGSRAAVRAVLPQLQRLRETVEYFVKDECPVDTGHLRDSVYTTLAQTSGRITLGITAKYARDVIDGHGVIVPTRKKVLHWVDSNGKDVFVTRVGPVPGNNFVLRGLVASQAIGFRGVTR